MKTKRTHCVRCGHFAPTGKTLCCACQEIERIKSERQKCQERLKEFLGPDGRGWKLTIREQSFTLPHIGDAKAKVKALLDLGLWYINLEEV